ncbi:MAG: Holliday junction branch migration protein RuvA [Leptospiraceae bacterium]|jgi:Holliday junction DNA helicase RuvA|nr:Holliday junction branch migration protein RuvA [Leptospiraceae bacterium]
MISKLKGKISRIGVQSIFIDTGNIEYEIFTPLNVIEYFQKNPEKNSSYEIFIYHHFQGEEQKLFGFLEFSQRELFRTIITLKGIGPSLGLSILSHLNTMQLIQICENHDIKTLTKIPRIGKTTAEEIIFEVNRKKKLFLRLLEHDSEIYPEISSDLEEVLQGMKYLGYNEKKVLEVIDKIKKNRKKLPQNTSEWIREVLKEI